MEIQCLNCHLVNEPGRQTCAFCGHDVAEPPAASRGTLASCLQFASILLIVGIVGMVFFYMMFEDSGLSIFTGLPKALGALIGLKIAEASARSRAAAAAGVKSRPTHWVFYVILFGLLGFAVCYLAIN
jgi:hypothetical protein